jgi:hypothetical protein
VQEFQAPLPSPLAGASPAQHHELAHREEADVEEQGQEAKIALGDTTLRATLARRPKLSAVPG